MNNLITKIDIRSLGTLNATFPALSHTRVTVYSTGDYQGGRKNGRPPSLWQKNQQTPGILLLHCHLCSKYKISPSQGKVLNLANE